MGETFDWFITGGVIGLIVGPSWQVFKVMWCDRRLGHPESDPMVADSVPSDPESMELD